MQPRYPSKARDHDLVRFPALLCGIDRARLELGPTEFLTKSGGSVQTFTSQVVRMLNNIAVNAEETEDAA